MNKSFTVGVINGLKIFQSRRIKNPSIQKGGRRRLFLLTSTKEAIIRACLSKKASIKDVTKTLAATFPFTPLFEEISFKINKIHLIL
jgi:hypothetical protein